MSEREADERIRLSLPPDWSAAPADLLTIRNDGEPDSIRWHVVFSRVFLLTDPDQSMGSVDVDVMGQTLEDVLAVIPRLGTIASAVALPWRVAISVEADAVKTAKGGAG